VVKGCNHFFYLGSSLSQTANLQTVFNLIATLVSNVEEIKKTLKVHTSLLHSIKRKVLVTEELLFDLPEDIKLPLTSIAELETLEEKLFCVEKKKVLVSSKLFLNSTRYLQILNSSLERNNCVK
jgi:hypothetical protein